MGAVTPTYLGSDWPDAYVKRQPDRVRTRQIKTLLVVLGAGVDDGDSVEVTLADHGLSNIKAIRGITHTTANSVLVVEAPTTAVSSGVLTITVGGSTDNKTRSFLIFGEAA